MVYVNTVHLRSLALNVGSDKHIKISRSEKFHLLSPGEAAVPGSKEKLNKFLSWARTANSDMTQRNDHQT